MPTTIKVALDWTPNPLHAGFYVALSKGLYAQAGLAVELISPSADGYATTPAKKLSTGAVDFCLCPSESVISYQSSAETSARIKACASLLSRDASAIVSRTASRPAELVGSGKKYASYGARYEDAIVQAMIDTDAGGRGKAGQLETVVPPKLGIWETVVTGQCDSTWIFEPFEGVQARRAGHNFKTFQLGDYGIPYGYSPLIAYRESSVNESAYKTFLAATGQGYEIAAKDPSEAASIIREAMLQAGLSERDTDLAFLKESQASIASYYNLEGGFGKMKSEVWKAFLGFLEQQGLQKDRQGNQVSVTAKQLFTNELLG